MPVKSIKRKWYPTIPSTVLWTWCSFISPCIENQLFLLILVSVHKGQTMVKEIG